MVPLYTLLLTGLTGLKWALAGRAARTERKYTRAALAAEELARAVQVKPGNASSDPFAAAKRHYALGRLVETRDKLGETYVGWQSRAEAVTKWLLTLRNWKGRAIPYLLGVIDVALILAVLHLLGLPHGLNLDAIKSWFETLKQ